jgi:acyl dehydratase
VTEPTQNIPRLYLEDLHIGQKFTSGTHHVTEERIKSFAQEFDPQPFHLDEAAANASVFGGMAASGWHTAAIVMRLLVMGGLPLGNGIIGLGGELAWPKPTRPGDTLRVESEIIEIIPSRSKPNQAIVKIRSTTTNQNAEVVHIFTARVLVSSGRRYQCDERLNGPRQQKDFPRIALKCLRVLPNQHEHSIQPPWGDSCHLHVGWRCRSGILTNVIHNAEGTGHACTRQRNI